MSSGFPGSIPTYSTFSNSDTLASMNHGARHLQLQDDIVAVATRVGTTGSADTTSHEYRIAANATAIASATTTANNAQPHTTMLDSLSASTYTGTGTVLVRQNSPTINTPVITVPVISDFTNAQHTHSSNATGGLLVNPYKFSIGVTGNPGIPTNTWTKVALGTKIFDTNNNFDLTNYRFIPPVNGYYQINAMAQVTISGSGATLNQAAIYKNGVGFRYGLGIVGSGSATTLPHVSITDIVYLATTDYLELWVLCVDSGRSVGSDTWMSGFFVST